MRRSIFVILLSLSVLATLAVWMFQPGTRVLVSGSLTAMFIVGLIGLFYARKQDVRKPYKRRSKEEHAQRAIAQYEKVLREMPDNWAHPKL